MYFRSPFSQLYQTASLCSVKKIQKKMTICDKILLSSSLCINAWLFTNYYKLLTKPKKN